MADTSRRKNREDQHPGRKTGARTKPSAGARGGKKKEKELERGPGIGQEREELERFGEGGEERRERTSERQTAGRGQKGGERMEAEEEAEEPE